MLTPITRQKTFTELVDERTATSARSDLSVYWSTDVDTLLDNQRTNLRAETAAISAGLNEQVLGCVHLTGTESISGEKTFTEPFNVVSVSVSASSGSAILPATPEGFINILVNGVSRRIPFYAQ